MKSSKRINNISAKLLSEIPKLKPGESVLFQMLNGVPNPEPDERERSKSPVLYGKVQLSSNFRIYDPYITNDEGKEVGGYVDVGAVEQWNGDNPERFVCFIPGQGSFSQFQGKFELRGGVVREEELYEVLWLSPQREGNPYRDTSVEPLFRIIDSKAESKKAITRVEVLKRALNLPSQISTDEARAIMAALNQPDYKDDEVLVAKLSEMARNNPELVIATHESKDTPIKATLKQALDKGIITHDLSSGDVKMGGMKIHSMKLDDLSTLVPQLLQWVKTSSNGKDVYENIKSQLSEKTVLQPA